MYLFVITLKWSTKGTCTSGLLTLYLMIFFFTFACQARERRDGENPDYQATDSLSATASYRAVGPTAEAT